MCPGPFKSLALSIFPTYFKYFWDTFREFKFKMKFLDEMQYLCTSQRHRHVKHIHGARITELTPDQPPVTWRGEPHKWFKCNCSLLAGRMLLDLPEVQSSICSNSIFQIAQKHGNKRQTTMCERSRTQFNFHKIAVTWICVPFPYLHSPQIYLFPCV